MTFLDMVNSVLTRLRERNVANVAINDYVRLIAILVNDAKREIENTWDWSALRTDLDVTTVAATSKYELNDTLNRTTILDVWDNTNKRELRYVDGKKMRQWLLDDPQSGQPQYYSYAETSADGDTQINVYPVPDSAYSLVIRAVQRETDLVNNQDTTLIPSQPITLLAYAKAVEERGEDAGVGASAAYALAYKSMSDHISIDANRRPEELIWQEV